MSSLTQKTHSQKQTPKNKKDLSRALLSQNLVELTKEEQKDILDYLIELPESLFDTDQRFRRSLINGIQNWLSTEQLPKEYLSKVFSFIYKLTIFEAKTDFYTFVKLTATNVIPNEYKDGRHIEKICKSLQELFESYKDPDKKTQRLQVFLPPRSMKSVLCSILFPAWILGQNPKYRILIVGGSMQTAVDVFGRPLKNFLNTEEYLEIFPETRMDNKVSSAQRFVTDVGGGYFCAGAGTGIAGRGGDFIICDDMLTEQSAFSKAERTKINMNYIPGIRSRSQPGAAELLVNTRWHLDDPSGYLLNLDKYSSRPWKVIKVSAILDKDASEYLKKSTDPAWAYKEGSSYWPEYKPLDDLLELKQNYMLSEPYKWNALYMQNPVPEEGNVVKYEDWQWWHEDEPPSVSQIIVCMDTAFSDKERSDYSAYTVWGIFYNRVETLNGIQNIPCMILLYAGRGKWGFHDLANECEKLRLTWKPDFFVIEKKQSGIVLLQELYSRGFPLVEYDPRGSKEERLQAAAAIMKANRVFVPSPTENDSREWAQEVVDEVCNFPSSQYDDWADTVSMAVIWMRDNGKIRHEAYDYEDNDDENNYVSLGGNTYWGSLFKNR